jgi:diguanylate cyclase (GGDEF)-like protein
MGSPTTVPLRILVVDDDAVARRVVAEMVAVLGHKCVAAVNGSEAWSIIQETPFDVVISDWMMPGLEGTELCRKIRERPGAGYVYFILASARGERGQVMAGMHAGADDYLVKPLDPDEIRARLVAAERVTSLHRQLAARQRELEELQRDAWRAARTDALTGLGNRLCLGEDLVTIQARSDRYGHTYCLALCDIDHFKKYNDAVGHLAGDAALVAVARTIREQCRSGDSPYRFGGEEFLLILPEQSLSSAAVAVERIREAVDRLAIPSPGAATGVITLSAGIADVPTGVLLAPDDALRRADTALYRAKDLGRNRVELWSRDH